MPTKSKKNTNTQEPTAVLLQKLGDPKWRISNLYYIKDKRGNKVLFKPNKEQLELIDNIWWFNIIPKARQLGITTFFCIYYLDAILFSSNKTAMIIAHTRDHAKKIFKEKIRFAWDNLPEWLKESIGETKTDSANELTFANGSTISVATSGRSGTVQYLHISEFGYTCAHYPDKAEEIVTGTINTVQSGAGMVSIESTAAGRDGYFYDFCMDAKRLQVEGQELTPLQFKLFFFPWWGHPEYIETGNVKFTREQEEYFKDLELKEQIHLSIPQKKWYVLKKAQNQEKMMAEYPSTIEEAFSASIQGAYYANEMAKVYEQQRITRVPYDKKYEVDTWWDLGMNDMNVIIFTQTVGHAIHVIDVYANQGEGLAHYVNVLKAKGYVYGQHTLPHDVEVRELGTGVSRRQVLYDLGMTDIRVGKKIKINDGIEKTRNLFSRLYFDEHQTEPLYSALGSYRKAWDDKRGVFMDKPVHDEHSHYCFSGDTKIKTKEGYKKIKDIRKGEYVDSPYGWTRVIGSAKTGEKETIPFGDNSRVTPDHPVLTQRGFVNVDTLRTGDKVLVCNKQKTSSIMGLGLEDIQNQNVEKLGFIISLFNRTKQAVKKKDYTDISGRKKPVLRFLKDILYITRMAIRLITSYQTLTVCRLENTKVCTCKNHKELKSHGKISEKPLPKHQSGTDQKKVSHGTKNTVKKVGETENKQLKNACSVEKNTAASSQTDQSTVHKNVRVEHVFSLATESGVYNVGGVTVSNCDALRTMAVEYREGISLANSSDMYDNKEQEDSFFQ